MKDAIHATLIAFTDFIYAVVFGLIVSQTFDIILLKDGSLHTKEWSQLLLIVTFFYFFVWDWILGRALTLKNPYENYTRFFFEVFIAVFAYGTTSAVLKCKSIFLIHFSVVLLLGALWARRTERFANARDRRELCMTQMLQTITALTCIALYYCWEHSSGNLVLWQVAVIIFVVMWTFILAYEMMVARPGDISAGPGVPFLARSDVRKIKRFLQGRG